MRQTIECRRKPRVSPKGIGRFGYLIMFLLVLVGYTAYAREGLLAEGSTGSARPCNTSLNDTITLQLAQNIELVLEHVSASIKALGEEYVRLYKKTSSMDKAEQRAWLDHSKREEKTIHFRPFTSGPEPSYQSPFPSYFGYSEKKLPPEIWRELKVFVALAPSFKIAYDTFDYSWVYFSTVDEAMLIYPYLPLRQAMNNYLPTKQVYYKAADFKNRTFGWTEPYLDLVGAGMMVTVSYPVYDKDKLLGVVSRDITLSQLSRQVLHPINRYARNLTSIIIDRTGLAIANSQVAAMKEINAINDKAGAAVLYYREAKEMASGGSPKAAYSTSALFNHACESVLALVRKEPRGKIWHLTFEIQQQRYNVTATRISGTGWLIVTLAPEV